MNRGGEVPAHPSKGQEQGWSQGWWHGALARPCGNFGARPEGTEVSLVVLHAISLPPGRYGGPEIECFFGNALDCDAHPYFDGLRALKVSAHFVIRRDGQVLQFVATGARAWHAGVSSWQGRDGCNDWSIGIELEGLAGTPFDDRQYPPLARLLAAIGQQHPIAQVVGHEHVAPGRKDDPGSGFDWTRLHIDTMSSDRWIRPPGHPGLMRPAAGFVA